MPRLKVTRGLGSPKGSVERIELLADDIKLVDLTPEDVDGKVIYLTGEPKYYIQRAEVFVTGGKGRRVEIHCFNSGWPGADILEHDVLVALQKKMGNESKG